LGARGNLFGSLAGRFARNDNPGLIQNGNLTVTSFARRRVGLTHGNNKH
jgi:hypothetical protein